MRNFKRRLAEALDNLDNEYEGLGDQDKFQKPVSWGDIVRMCNGREGEAYVVFYTVRYIQEEGAQPEEAFQQAVENENYDGDRPDIVAARLRMAAVLLQHFNIRIFVNHSPNA